MTFLVSAVCLLAIRAREAPVGRSPHPATLRAEMAEGLRFVFRDPYLRVLMVFGAVSNLGLIGYQAILVVFLVREVGVGPGTAGTLVAVTGLGAVAGALCATSVSRRLGSARALLVCAMAGEPCGLLIPLGRPGGGLGLVLAGGFAVAMGVVAGNVIKSSFRQSYTPHAMLGRVSVSMQFVNYGTLPLGAVLAGALGGAIGVRPAMWVMTGVLALSGPLLLAGPLKRRRDLPAAPAGQGRMAPLMP